MQTKPHNHKPNIVSIAGSDPGGGAGIQADLKTMTALGCYGVAVVAALTAQNTRGVQGVHPVPPEFLKQQLTSVFDDIRVDAVKIGMIGSADAVRVIADILQDYKPSHIVLDPVMIATSGDALIDEETRHAMIEYLIPLASILTPNIPEHKALGEDIECPALLLKGGHAPDQGQVSDVLIMDGARHVFTKPFISTQDGEFHGTGCTLSSALACYLALGFDLPMATGKAQDYVFDAIQNHDRQNVGGGARPLDHGYNIKTEYKASRSSEFDVIERYFAPLSQDGLNNDAAVFEVPDGHELVVSTDALNEGTHVPRGCAPELFAGKALRVNLSDLASMGARPLYYQLSLSLPQAIDDGWYESFAAGLKAVQDEFGITLSGGDTTTHHGAGISVSITVFGAIKQGAALPRGGAQDGDLIVVSGTIGDAAAGLECIKGYTSDHVDDLVERYYSPSPRLVLGALASGYVRACIDISDGVFADIAHIARHSGLKAQIEYDCIPVSDAFENFNRRDLIGGGDDYELAFAVSEDRWDAFKKAAQKAGVPLTSIGRFTSGSGVEILDDAGQVMEMKTGGWMHF